MESLFDKLNIRVVPEGILICDKTASRQDSELLQELCRVLGALLNFAQFARVRTRHAQSLERALDERDQELRRKNFEAESVKVFQAYSAKLKELQDKDPHTGREQRPGRPAGQHHAAARKFVREHFQNRYGETQMLIAEGRRIVKARQPAKPKPHSRRRDRLDPSLKKHKRKRGQPGPVGELARRQLAHARELVRGSGYFDL